jgi:creatinine amidohydrolase
VPDAQIPRHVLWQKRRRGEIREAAEAGGLVLLPTGAVEPHGPRPPLDSDSFTAFTVCARAAGQVSEFPVPVLPPTFHP